MQDPLLTQRIFATSNGQTLIAFVVFSELLPYSSPKMAPGPFPPEFFLETRFTWDSKDLNCSYSSEA